MSGAKRQNNSHSGAGAHKKIRHEESSSNPGLPYPNFGVGGDEAVVCTCIYDGSNFYVSGDNDMHILNHNGSFGTSTLTFRGLSYGDTKFKKRAYYKKKMESEKNLASGNNWLSNGPISNLDLFITGKGQPLKVELDSSKSGKLQSAGTGNRSVLSKRWSTWLHGTKEPASKRRRMEDLKVERSPMQNMFGKCEPKLFDRFPETEKLILMPEEAIFLSFAIGCLKICNLQGEPLSYGQCWKDIVARDPDFPVHYGVYHYFRAKNWVPKKGDNFGASYVVYEGSPKLQHSTHIVHILDSRKPKPAWMEVAAWLRLAGHVRKRPILVEVSVPGDFLPEKSDPRSVFDLKLSELSLTRWNPFGHNQS